MKVEINRLNKNFHFQGFGSSGIPVNIDGSAKIGGDNAGARPMELILMGLGTCGAMDIINILKKQKQDLRDFKIEIDGDRNSEQVPSVFNNIKINFIFYGNLDRNKVEKAVNLSMGKYCSVSAMLEKTVKISYTFSINKVDV